MTKKTGLPSEDELAELSKASVAVYALRCALRVKPFLMFPRRFSTEFKDAVLQVEHHFNILVRNLDGAVSMTASHNALAATSDPANDNTKAALSAEAANNAFISILTSEGPSADDVVRLATIASKIAASILEDCVIAARADYEALRYLGENITDASETGPLGDIWHGLAPHKYIEAKEHYDKNIVEWERELAKEEGNLSGSAKVRVSTSAALDIANTERESLTPLSVYIDPGTSPPELITDLYIALDALYRANGGSGLEIVKEERRSMAGEIV